MPQDDLASTVLLKSCEKCRKNYTSSLGNCPDCGGSLVSWAQDPLLGARLADRYRVEAQIGVGGMGVVYKGWHELMKRPVAIKVLRPQLINDEASTKRFRQEAVAASRLKHPNIITVYDFGETTNGRLYLVMDLLEGYSLAEPIKEKGYIGVERTIKIFSQVCDALNHAHRQGVIHRDLKPGNVMICPTENDKDFVKLVDFGIAKMLSADEDLSLTQKGEVFGSPLYMSPEQCLGKPLDGRSDIYSLGIVIYEALVGYPPFLGENMIATIDMQIHKLAPTFNQVRPDLYIPPKVEAAVLKALSKDPQDRQQSMEELRQELQEAIPGRTFVTARSKDQQAEELKRKVVWLGIALAGTATALVLSFLAYIFLANQHSQKQAPVPALMQQKGTASGSPPGSVPLPVLPAPNKASGVTSATATAVPGSTPLKPSSVGVPPAVPSAAPGAMPGSNVPIQTVPAQTVPVQAAPLTRAAQTRPAVRANSPLRPKHAVAQNHAKPAAPKPAAKPESSAAKTEGSAWQSLKAARTPHADTVWDDLKNSRAKHQPSQQ